MAVLTAGFMGVGAMGLAVPFAIGELSDPIVIGGTTTVIGGTTTVIGGTTTVIGGSTITTPGSTITTPGSTIVSTITIATPGNPALMFAKSTACNAIVLQGANSQFQGAVVSNGGVDAHSSGMGGDTLVWGTTVAPGCLTVNSSLWGSITSQAPIDWPAPLPVCTPGCTPTNAAAQAQITSVDGATCTPAPAVNWAINSALAPGLYCARGSISVRANLTNVGLVAPTIDVRGVVVSGTSFLPAYGGLAFYAYAAGGTVVSSSGIGFSFRGAIYAPFGQVDLIVSGSQAACPDPTAAGCGFIEADTVRLAGANAKWQGLGPGFGGSTTTTTTTTTPGSTTTTPGVITTYPSITTTIPGTTTVIGGTTTVIGGTTTVIGGVTVTIPSGPVVASFDPLVGGVGTVVTISGSYLAGTTDVFFGGTPAASFTVNDDSTVTATVPLGASSGPISVATAAGTAASFLPFTFVPAPTFSSFSPAAGSIGTVVSIVGADLTGATSVAFNGTDVTSFLVNDAGTLLTASVPEGAITGVISVTTPGGSTSSATAFVVDGVAPTVLISSGPDDPSSSASASFVFAASDAGSGVASVECQVDDGAFAACLSPLGLSDLSEGAHTFTVRATDYAGNTDVTPASYAWVVDTLAPTTTIDINPPNPSNDSTPTFTFTGADTPGSGVASFECQIDSDGFSACTTPDTLAALTDGSHTFDVRAIDKAGNTDVTPASYTWVVDTVKPDVTVNQRSEFPAQGDPTNAQPILFTAVFSKEINASTFGTGDVTLSGCPGATASLSPVLLSLNTYEISVTGMIDPTNCTLTVSIPMDGVEDLAGNLNTDSTSSDNSVTYDTIAPETTIGTKPSDPSNDATPDFTYSGTDIGGSGVASYECKIDLGSFAVCSSSPKTLTTLTEGSHTFSVRAIDNAGNVDATPDSYTWVTDTIAPTVAYASQSPAANGAGWNKTDVVATFTATDLLSGFAGPSTTKTGTTTSSGEGVAVNVDSPAFTDLVGNTAAAGTASHSVKIDKTPPVVTCPAAPQFVLNQPGQTLTATVSDVLSGAVSPTVSASAITSVSGSGLTVLLTGSDKAGNSTAVSCPYSVVNGFLGFATPLPKSILGTNSAIVVKFQLGNNAGVALTDEAASAVQTQATISANADGSSPLSLVNCAYSKTSHRYQCSLKAPKNVAKYPTPYYLTVYEMIGSTYVKAPAVASSTSSNPEIVYFK